MLEFPHLHGLPYGWVNSWSHPSLAQAWRCLSNCGQLDLQASIWRRAAGRSFRRMDPASSTHLLHHPWVSLGRHLTWAGACRTLGPTAFGGVTGAVLALESGLAGMEGAGGPLGGMALKEASLGMAGLGGRPGGLGQGLGWRLGGMAGLAGVIGGMAGLEGPLGLPGAPGGMTWPTCQGGGTAGALTVWIGLAGGDFTGWPGWHFGVKLPRLVDFANGSAACQCNADDALTLKTKDPTCWESTWTGSSGSCRKCHILPMHTCNVFWPETAWQQLEAAAGQQMDWPPSSNKKNKRKLIKHINTCLRGGILLSWPFTMGVG